MFNNNNIKSIILKNTIIDGKNLSNQKNFESLSIYNKKIIKINNKIKQINFKIFYQ